MLTHRLCVAALAVSLLGIAPAALAQPPIREPDGLAWDLVDEDCGMLPEGRSSAEEDAPSHQAVATVTTPERSTRRSRRGSRSAEATTSVAPHPGPESAAAMPSRAPHDASETSAPIALDPSHDGTIPRGRAVGALTAAACEAVLRAEGVPFERVSTEAARVIEQPIRLGGALRGVRIQPHGGDESSIHSIIDCRLAVALLGWAGELREAGFVALEHVSVFRPGARVARTHRPSGHSHALAIDALRLVRSDGTFFSVLDDWAARARGTDPCATYEEPEASATVRRLVCNAIARETFQVVITPHHDDAHANHVHLEIVPGVDWTVAR